MQQESNRRVGSIADYDPVNEQYGSLAGQNRNYHRSQAPPQQQQTMRYEQAYPQQQPQVNMFLLSLF